MTQFNISRFGRTLKWTVVNTRKEMLTVFALMTFVYSVPFIMELLSSRGEELWQKAEGISMVTSMNFGLFILMCMIAGCWLFNNMKTKEQRITFKMLPATGLEKFVARALYVTLIWWFMAIAAFCLADVLRMLISLVAGIDIVKCAIPEFLHKIFGSSVEVDGEFNGLYISEIIAFVVMLNTLVFWVHSLYILGGALFRRRQLVMTTLVHFILGVAAMPFFIHIVESLDDNDPEQFIGTLLWISAAVFAILGVANWILSYKIFKRMQVINNKWINL